MKCILEQACSHYASLLLLPTARLLFVLLHPSLALSLEEEEEATGSCIQDFYVLHVLSIGRIF